MDNIDIKILNCLKKNSRQKASDISQQVNLSVSAVIERIRKLESMKLIKQYTVILDQKQLGNSMVAFIEVSLEHPKYCDNFTKMILKNEYAASCHYITGDFDYLVKIITDSPESLEQIHREIKSMEGVSLTKTHFALSTIKNELTVLPKERLLKEKSK